MINRAAVILRYKEPFIKWINESDPYYDNPAITSGNANDDSTVYLVSVEDGENIAQWISSNYEVLFENELEDWYTDESLWPRQRDRKAFDAWFDVECHTVIIDTLAVLIRDDEE